MATGAGSQEGSLLAFICDQDTATGLLLTGIGHVDYRKTSNFLIVDESEFRVLWLCEYRGVECELGSWGVSRSGRGGPGGSGELVWDEPGHLHSRLAW